MQLLKIIKINILAMIALPIFLLSIAGKLIARAMEKIVILSGAAILIIISTLIAELIRNQGSSGSEIILALIGLIIGGAIAFLVLSFASSVCMYVAVVIIAICDVLYEKCYEGYEYLYSVCEYGYSRLEISNRFLKRLFGLCYLLLCMVNKVLVFLIRHSLKICIALSLILVGGSLYYFDLMARHQLGMSLFAYLKSCGTLDLVYICFIYILVMAAAVMILVSLGSEWSEWGIEMEMSSTGSSAYYGRAEEYKEAYQSNPVNDDSYTDHDQHCYNILNTHLDSFEAFSQEVASFLKNSGHMVLQTDFGEYMSALDTIMALIKKYNHSIPVGSFRAVIPEIEKMERLKQRIYNQIEKIRQELNKRSQADSFFGGCITMEKLEKRYRALCKVYHPDGELGDTDTFVRMRQEYEQKAQELS